MIDNIFTSNSYAINKIDSTTWQIIEKDKICSVYCYLLEGNKASMLIDTGIGRINLPQIVKQLTSKPVFVMYSHGHLDHIGNNNFRYAFLHKNDYPVFVEHSKYQLRKLFGYPEIRANTENLHFFTYDFSFDLGNRPINIIGTPGHTAGSICVLDCNRGYLFSGDHCCKADVLLNFEHSTSLKTYSESLRKLLVLKEDISFVFPSHHESPICVQVVEEFYSLAMSILNNDGTYIKEKTNNGTRYKYLNGAVNIVM
jgi:hydroxyacylglutathione hydrolase